MPRPKKDDPLKREYDVAATKLDEYTTVPGHGVFNKVEVVGQVTRNRVLIGYELQFLRDSLLQIERARPKDMPWAIEQMREKIEVVATTANRIMEELGDTDPRYHLPN